MILGIAKSRYVQDHFSGAAVHSRMIGILRTKEVEVHEHNLGPLDALAAEVVGTPRVRRIAVRIAGAGEAAVSRR